MGREKKGGSGAATGSHAKDRHKRDRKGNLIDWAAPLPPGLVAKPERPQPSSKHKSYFEFIENKDKKRKLEFEFTTDRRPPPGFEFVPIGNPALTTACKELSREHGAMIFIVTQSGNSRFSRGLSFHLNRVGHHIRGSIVEEARKSLGDSQEVPVEVDPGVPEPIPERQEDINKQADLAIRDLFPRIPNMDREMVIQHAFNKTKKNDDEPPVGLAPDITLSRRVQLAVLAHIRHNHTRYDQLLRETTYVNARKAVEPLCLDILVKWRGDEETGRDQLDEILCEVIVISDSESEDEDGDDDSEEESSDTSVSEGTVGRAERPAEPPATGEKPAPGTTGYRRGDSRPRAPHAGRKAKIARKDRRAAKKAQRGFSRYQAALDRAWHQAVERQRVGEPCPVRATTVMSLDGPVDQSAQPRRATEYEYGQPELRDSHGQGQPQPHAQFPSYNDPWPIVGPRPVLQTDSMVERARSLNQDLKDHLVRSIEPYSPQADQFPAQFPGPSHVLQERGPFPVSRTSMEPSAYRQTRPAQFTDIDPPGGYYPNEQQDFITLTPRYETGRIPAAPPQHQGSVVPVSPQSHLTGREYTPMDVIVSGRYPPPAYHNDPAIRNDRLVLRSESRPIWVEDEGAALRSERRPIVIRDDAMQARPLGHDAARFSFENRPPPARGATSAHPSGPTYATDRNIFPFDGRTSHHARVRSQPDGLAEIVRVSNKFPRRHEASIPVESERYALRSRVPQQPEPPQISDGLGRHEFQPAPVPHQRIERVVARVDRPMTQVGGTSDNIRPPDGYVTNFPRQERVVGIEYVPVTHIREVRTYADQPQSHPYELGHVVHQPQFPSVARMTYPDDEYIVHHDQLRRDGVITYDRRQ